MVKLYYTNGVNYLDVLKLEFEETPRTMTKKETKQRRGVKEVLKTNAENLKAGVFTLATKVKAPKKPAKKLTKAQKKERKEHRLRVIMGIGLLLVVMSIGYSTFVILTLVDSWVALFVLAPQIVFAIITTLKAFSNIYK